MRDLIDALREYLIAKGKVNGRKVFHFLLPNGVVIEIVE